MSDGITIINRAAIQERPSFAPKAVAVPDDAGVVSPKRWVYWSLQHSDNMYPQLLQMALKKSAVIRKSLAMRAALHYGRGPIMYRNEFNDDGTRVRQLQWPGQVDEFWRRNRMSIHLLDIIRDFETYKWAWAQVILSNDRSRINRVFHVDAAQVRIGTLPEDGAAPQMAYYSADWPNPSVDEYQEYPVIDPDYPNIALDAYPEKRIFFYPITQRTSGQVYYPQAEWHGAWRAGWVDVAAKVPDLKRAMFENQMAIKYVIYIDDSYWRLSFSDWDNWTEQEKKKKQKEVKESIEKSLTDIENAYKTIIAGKWYNPKSGNIERLIDIEVLDDKIKDGAFLPDSASANSEILYGLIDPSLLGHGIPGGKDLAGSGSDKRLSFQIHQQTILPDQERTLDLMRFVANHNGWPAGEWAYQSVDLSQTLDQNPTGSRETL